MRNWKTNLSGLAMIVGAIADILTYAAKGMVTPNLNVDFTAIMGGIGLLFAKDFNVSSNA